MRVDRSTYRFDPFVLDAAQRRLTRDGQEIALQPKLYDTLYFLLTHADRVVSKDELIDQLWPGVVVTEHVLTRAISALRRALGDRPADSRYIRAMPRVGYRFVAALSTETDASPTPSLLSVAVLPFQSLPDAVRDESLELGMADTLISLLARVGGLLVRPLNAVLAVVGAERDPQQAAEHLRVDAYVDATIQLRDGRVRVNARLVKTADQSVLWSETFNEVFEHVFSVQDAIGERIASALGPRLPALVKPQRPTNENAYRAYLEARLYLSRHTLEDLQHALQRFEDAIDEDPAYAPAWAGLGETHLLLGTQGGDVQRRYEGARRASRRALAIDPEQAEAPCTLANIAWQYEWDWPKARALFEDGFRRAPQFAALHISCSDFCCYMRQSDAAIDHARQALRIDPVSPYVNALLAQALYMAGRHVEAIEWAERSLALAPDFGFARLFAGLASVCLGDSEQGLAHINKALGAGRPDLIAALGLCHAVAGHTDQAEAILGQLQQQADAVPPIATTLVALGLGRSELALAKLEECFRIRDWHILLLHADPVIRPLVKAPEVLALIARLKLPAPAVPGPASSDG